MSADARSACLLGIMGAAVRRGKACADMAGIIATLWNAGPSSTIFGRLASLLPLLLLLLLLIVAQYKGKQVAIVQEKWWKLFVG